MIGAYGHDDRVDAYPALLAEIETKDPVHTTICVLTDKEEIGSDGVTGMQSMYAVSYTHLMYTMYAQNRGWTLEVLNLNETELGVHAQQAVGKQGGFLAAGTAADLHDDVFAVVHVLG